MALIKGTLMLQWRDLKVSIQVPLKLLGKFILNFGLSIHLIRLEN